jgi:MarR family transcriptional regulator, organic hydroperoxide resistance regulator
VPISSAGFCLLAASKLGRRSADRQFEAGMERSVRTRVRKSEHVEFHFEDFFPHLINRATGKIRADFESRSKRLGISIEKWRVLICLLTQGPQNITNLASSTTIEVPTMSFLLKRMVRERLVTRDRHDNDGRVTVISLTSRGRAITLKLHPIVRRYEQVAFRGFSAREVAILKDQLRAIIRNLENLRKHDGARPAALPAERKRSR